MKHTHKLMNVHERPAKLTEWTALSQTGGHSATLIENSSNIYFIYLYLTLKHNKPGNLKASCCLGDRIAEDHTHTDITSNVLERSVIDY